MSSPSPQQMAPMVLSNEGKGAWPAVSLRIPDAMKNSISLGFRMPTQKSPVPSSYFYNLRELQKFPLPVLI